MPRQLNGSDCGVFVAMVKLKGYNLKVGVYTHVYKLQAAWFLAEGRDLTFSQQEIPLARRRMAVELTTGTLLPLYMPCTSWKQDTQKVYGQSQIIL